METLHSNPPNLLLQPQTHLMNSIIRPNLFLKSPYLRALSTSLPSSSTSTHCLINTAAPAPVTDPLPRKKGSRKPARVGLKAKTEQLKRDWLASLSSPLPQEFDSSDDINIDGELITITAAEDWEWVIGIDPDVSGALAIVKSDESGYSAQVFDSPHLKVMVGKGSRKRLDASSMVQLLRSLNAPTGTTAYVEQSTPFPTDGKLGWWSGGFNYGLWIGVLIASGFSVVPVPSSIWKRKFQLYGSSTPKDDCRRIASTLFPSLSPMLKRKMDHGRADSLLIATYGVSLKMDSKLNSEETQNGK